MDILLLNSFSSSPASGREDILVVREASFVSRKRGRENVVYIT